MTTSLLRGLRTLEMLGAEALGVSEIARRLEVDKAGVSRMLNQLHQEGWVLRTGARYVLGGRALGLTDADRPDVRRRATRLAQQLHDRTGLTAIVLRLAGDGAQPIALAGSSELLEPEAPYVHLWATAGGIALLAQLPDPEVERRLAVDPWPEAPTALPGPEAVLEMIRTVRSGSPAEERRWTVAEAGCTAVPWPVPQAGSPHAALVLGPADELERDAETIRRALRDGVLQH